MFLHCIYEHLLICVFFSNRQLLEPVLGEAKASRTIFLDFMGSFRNKFGKNVELAPH